MDYPIKTLADWATFYVAGGLCLLPLALIGSPGLRNLLMRKLRQRSATVICVGAGIAAGAFIFGEPQGYPQTLFEGWLGNGLIAAFGIALLLIGVWFWLAEAGSSRVEHEQTDRNL